MSARLVGINRDVTDRDTARPTPSATSGSRGTTARSGSPKTEGALRRLGVDGLTFSERAIAELRKRGLTLIEGSNST